MDTSLYSFPALLFFSPFFVSFSLLIRIGVPTLVSAVARTSKSGYVRKKQKKTVVFFLLLLLCVCVSGSRHPHFFFLFSLFSIHRVTEGACCTHFFLSANFSGDLRQILRERLLFLFLRAPPAFLFYIIPRLSFPLCVAVVVYLFVCCVRVLGSLCIYVLQLRKE